MISTGDCESHMISTGDCENHMISARDCVVLLLSEYHLLHLISSVWLSTVRVGASTEGPQLELDFSVASAELWEYLYRNEANLPHITKPVSVSPVSYCACKCSVESSSYPAFFSSVSFLSNLAVM